METVEGTWIVANRYWNMRGGPGDVVPYPNEIRALRAANETEYLKAWFVPFGTSLRDVMNDPSK